ncbi:MAG: hypothetical protein FK733_15460, partial [Asgard group archaeon]|nr:hypothetical protein [Asgard group archaeon]
MIIKIRKIELKTLTNKSGVSEQIISLPKGGGAIKGLGEKFQPDMHTGTGNYSIPLDIPLGRNGFQPNLTLQYSTGNNNGPYGLGWNINTPNISRKTAKGIPKYKDYAKKPNEFDTFILSGSEDLVLIKENLNEGMNKNEIHRYFRPKIEGLFAKIKHVIGINKNYWEITTKSGIKNFYGDDKTSQIYDEENQNHIYKWLLSKSIDTFGNIILYQYKRDNGRNEKGITLFEEGFKSEFNHSYNCTYISKISYVNYRNENLDEKFLFSILFDYGDYDENGDKINPWECREDPFSFNKAGF